MSSLEESLEDKIAAIMSGNFNFGPPTKAPSAKPAPAAAAPPQSIVTKTAPLPSITLSSKSSQNSLSEGQSGRFSSDDGSSKSQTRKSPAIIDVSSLVAPDSGKIHTVLASNDTLSINMLNETTPIIPSAPSSTKSNPTEDASVTGNQSRKNSAESLSQSSKVSTIDVNVTNSLARSSSIEMQPSPLPGGSLSRKGSALVGFGDVYDDVTSSVVYDERDLHRDAVSDGYLGAVAKTGSGVDFGDVYVDKEKDLEYDQADHHGVAELQDAELEEEELAAEEGEEEDQNEKNDVVEPAPAAEVPTVQVQETKSTRVPTPKTASPLPLTADSVTDLQDQLLAKKQPSVASLLTAEDTTVKVQPQLEFVPLSMRKSPQEALPAAAVEDKGLALDRERLNMSADKKDRISPTDQPLLGLRASSHSSFVTAPTAAPVLSSTLYKAPSQQKLLQEDAEIDEKVHSLLFGEDGSADEGEEEDEEVFEEEEPLSFSPDEEGQEEKPEIVDDDSLNGGGEEEDHEHEHQNTKANMVEDEVEQDLAQTIRTTVPLSPAVRTLPPPSSNAIAPVSEKRSATVEQQTPAKAVSAAQPTLKEQEKATPVYDQGLPAPIVVVPSTQTHTLGLPPKPRATTPTSLARERAALLLPTIPEEKAPAHAPHASTHKAHSGAKSAVPAAHPVQTPAPIKVPTSSDNMDRSHFLHRLSAATSVAIEVPHVPASATKHAPVVHKEHHKVKEHKETHSEASERSTAPTSVPKPVTTSGTVAVSAIPQRSTTPPSTARPVSASSTAASSTAGASSGDSGKAAPRSVPRSVASKGEVATVNRAASPPSARKAVSEAPLSATKRGVAVMMSTTSADEIAAASAHAQSAAASSAKGGSGKNSAMTGVKESTLLSSPPPQKDHPKSKPATAAPVSAKKVKPEAWVIDSSVLAQAESGESSAATASASATKRSSSKAAAWTIENVGPASSGANVGTSAQAVPASPALKPPVRSRTPEPIQRGAASPAATGTSRTSIPIPVTVPKNASLSTKLSQSPEEDASPTDATESANRRSRAVSPNTTGKSVSRLAPPQPAGGSDDAPVHERAVKVAVRVRPLTSAEIQQGQRRTISMNDGRMVIVNPKSFDSQPDAVARVAVATDNRQWATLFEFDNILWDYNATTGVETLVDQIELHHSLGLDIVENALSGISSSCFAYGHTCTGKTYSLFGPDMLGQDHASNGRREPVSKFPTSLAKFSITAESGLIQRVFHDIMRLSHKNTRMFVTFMEIYNEKIRDLLCDNPGSVSQSMSDVHSTGSTTGRIHAPTHVVTAPDSLKLREHPTFGPYVENLTKVEVFSVNDALRLIARGQANRTSAQTVWNANSSRSHAVVTLELSPTEIDPSKQFVDPRAREVYENSQSPVSSPAKCAPSAVGEEADLYSLEGRMEASNREHLRNYEAPLLQQVVRVQMVDLAGSEKDTINPDDESVWSGGRHNDTTLSKFPDSQAEKEKNELRLIRRSLSTLGFIIKALTKGATMRSLPYRDCTLTFLLRDALCGRNHTTMLATISPAHTCYEETLSTLRYAERLCEVHTNRRKAAAASGLSAVASMNDNVLGPRKAVLDEFMRIHQGLRVFKRPTGNNTRDLLRQTLVGVDQQQQRARLSNLPVSGSASSSTGGGGKYPLNGFTKPLDEVTEDDFTHFKDSYRQLSTEVVEMQIDLDAVRTDRDTLMVELRRATDMLNELESAKNEARSQVGSLTKYLRAAEKELADLHGLLKKRDENVDRLLGELSEEKQARSSAEQAYQARTKEFLARFDALKKENRVLAGSLDTVSDKHKSTADEKKDQAQQIERLRAQVKALTAQRDAASAEVETLKEEQANVTKRYDAASVKVGRFEELEKQLTALILQNEKHKSDVAIAASERDSLRAMLAQKDSAMQAQTQQSERAVRMLQMKLTAAERMVILFGARSDIPLSSVAASSSASSHTAAGPGATAILTASASVSGDSEYSKLQERVNALLSAEGQILHSELADTRKLTSVVKDMRLKLQEFEDLKFELQLERAAKEDLQKKLTEHSVNSQVSEVGKSALDHQVSLLQIELHQAQELQKKQEQEHQLQIAVVEGNKASLEEQVSTLQKDLLTTKDALALTKARLQQQTNLAAKSSVSSADLMKAQAESAALKDQLILTQRDAFAAREELKSTQETMQAEYAKMWSSVQELSKLDALKDQSIQDLIMDRDKAILERDGALERFVAAKTESAQLLQELQDIDIELLHAVEAGEYRLSPRGQHKSVMLHNVSDRTMFGLARRQQQAQQTLQALHLPSTATASRTPGSGSGGASSVYSTSGGAANMSTSYSGGPVGASGGMGSISQLMGMANATSTGIYDSPSHGPGQAAAASATSTPVLMFNHPNHIPPPPAAPHYTLPVPSSANSVGRSAPQAGHQSQPAGYTQQQQAQWSGTSSVQGRAPTQQQQQQPQQFQQHPMPRHQPQHQVQAQQQQRYPPDDRQPYHQQRQLMSSQQSLPQQQDMKQSQSWTSQQYAASAPLPSPANYARQGQRPTQQQEQQPSPPSSQQAQRQYAPQHQQQQQMLSRSSGSFQQPQGQDQGQGQQGQSTSSAAYREEKEYTMSEEALEKELEELSVLEGEVRSKRQRMKSGGLSSSNTSMSSINMQSAKKATPMSKMNY